MDSNNIIIMVVSGLLGFFMVKFYQMRKEMAQMDMDRQLDMIYETISHLRMDLEKEVEKLTNKIENTECDMQSELDNRYRAFSNAINDADRRIDEIVYNNSNKEPTLFDNVP